MGRGFDFLGYHFKPQGITLAPKTITNLIENGLRLYERGDDNRWLWRHVTRWTRWLWAAPYIVIDDVTDWSGLINLIGVVTGW